MIRRDPCQTHSYMGFELKAKGRSDGKAKEKILCSGINSRDDFVGVESRVSNPETTFVGVESRVRVLHIPSRFQFADIFTKGLPSALFEEFRTSLSVRCPPAPTAGEC
ncbi:hypothetical protein Tco_0228555 [Tanacetum coccineum]